MRAAGGAAAAHGPAGAYTAPPSPPHTTRMRSVDDDMWERIQAQRAQRVAEQKAREEAFKRATEVSGAQRGAPVHACGTRGPQARSAHGNMVLKQWCAPHTLSCVHARAQRKRQEATARKDAEFQQMYDEVLSGMDKGPGGIMGETQETLDHRCAPCACAGGLCAACARLVWLEAYAHAVCTVVCAVARASAHHARVRPAGARLWPRSRGRCTRSGRRTCSTASRAGCRARWRSAARPRLRRA